jgi:PBP1b-binding outer membrane lipoprotein LpoB
MNKIAYGIVILSAVALAGCTTQTRRYAAGETRQTVTGFSEEDINDTVSRAIQSVCSQDRIKLHPGSNRAILIVEDVVNDTLSRGRDAGALAEALGQSLREELTNGGKVVVYNKEVGQYATVKVNPQYILRGRLTQRNLRQDDGDIQIEYNLNLTLIDIQTGLEFWQKRVHVGKLADSKNIM